MTGLMIGNKGAAVASTNYWMTEYAENGIYFMSVNAGACRLLVPSSEAEDVEEMATGGQVQITVGFSVEHQQHCMEIVFFDGTDSPFHLLIGCNQWDMIPKAGDRWRFTVWVEGDGGQPVPVLDLPCEVRKAEQVH